MLAVQRSDSSRRVFLYLYTISDQDGFFELDAAKISLHTGLSRKTVYKAIAFLQRVRLLFLEEARTGRGRHSLYKLNWRKPAQKLNPQKQEKQCSEVAEIIVQEKCHPCINKEKLSKNIHPSGDGTAPICREIISPMNRTQWNQCMKAFREVLQRSRLAQCQQRLCVGVLGRHLKGKPRSYALQLFEKLRRVAPKLQAPGWVSSVVELCRWFMGLLKHLFRPRPRRRRFRDSNEYLQHLHEREVERVMLKRAEYERQSWAERLQEWARQQLQELAWRRKQAELVRQRFCLRSSQTVGPL